MPRKQAPTLRPYTLELTYMVPYCGTFTVSAENPEDACAKAFALLEQDPSAYEAFDTSAEWETGPTFVESIVEGEVPWGCAGVGAAVSVPTGWGDPEEAREERFTAVYWALRDLYEALGTPKGRRLKLAMDRAGKVLRAAEQGLPKSGNGGGA